MTMSMAEWLKVTLDGAPPLTEAQVSALRPIFAPVIPHMHAAPAVTARAAPAQTATSRRDPDGTA